MSSIFTKIIKGDIPSIKVHEDNRTLAIMDIHPIQPGQILIFPKSEVSTIWDLSTEDYQALMTTVQKAGQKIREAYPDKSRVGVVIEGLDVKDHAHVKVYPFSTAEEFHADPANNSSIAELQNIANRLGF